MATGPSQTAVRRQVEKVIQCGSCRKEPTDPKALSCTHTYCLTCLQDHFKKSSKGGLNPQTITCSICKKVTPIPRGGLKYLETDYKAIQLAGLVKQLAQVKVSASPSASVLTPEDMFTKAVHIHELLSQNDEYKAMKILGELSCPRRKKVVSEYIEGRKALAVAVENGLLEAVKYIVQQCEADVEQLSEFIDQNVDSKPEYQVQPLWLSVTNQNLQIINYLLQCGADINARTSTGSTPLRTACYHGNLEIVTFLIRKGADVNSQNNEGSTNLHAGCRHVTVCKVLIQHGADVNRQNNRGWSTLHTAAKLGTPETVQVLLDNGADVNRQDNDGWSALHAAAEVGTPEAVQVLLDNGADVNRQRTTGDTPLHEATREGRLDVIKKLVNHGADINICANDGSPPTLCIAINNEDLTIVTYLLEHGADANNMNGTIKPLVLAVEYCNPSITRLLIKHGADPIIRDRDGDNAFEYAQELGHTHLVKILQGRQ